MSRAAFFDRSFWGALALVSVFAACSPSSGEVREWKPADHDRGDSKRTGAQVSRTKQVADEAETVELAWSKNCVRCHGALGQGDGPMGGTVHAPDLTRDEFLSSKSDEEIATTIRSGRNEMPPFNQIPERVLAGIVQRIRGKGHF